MNVVLLSYNYETVSDTLIFYYVKCIDLALS